MKNFFNKMFPRGFKKRETEGQVQNRGQGFDKSFGVKNRNWGLATHLEKIRNRGKRNG